MQNKIAENRRTHGDLLFEKYLKSRDIEFEFEKEWSFTDKLPDYSLLFKNNEFVVCEVKEVVGIDPNANGSIMTLDPYSYIRQQIKTVQNKKQLKGFRERQIPTALVLWSANAPWMLLDMNIMSGAIYGNIGYKVSIGDEQQDFVPSFGRGGSMLNPLKTDVQNTSISSIISLSVYPIGELWNHLQGLYSKEKLNSFGLYSTKNRQDIVVGATVWRNEYAAVPFPMEIINGPFDHRFASDKNGNFGLQFKGEVWEVLS